LRRRLKVGTLAALDQRVGLRSHLDGMDLSETLSYLTHHLKLAGRSDTLFTDDAIGLLHQTSRGIPRAVNNLLQALVAALPDGKGTVDESAARAAVTEVTGD
jgi:type II secretory pathway predicted ATPase ExeA